MIYHLAKNHWNYIYISYHKLVMFNINVCLPNTEILVEITKYSYTYTCLKWRSYIFCLPLIHRFRSVQLPPSHQLSFDAFLRQCCQIKGISAGPSLWELRWHSALALKQDKSKDRCRKSWQILWQRTVTICNYEQFNLGYYNSNLHWLVGIHNCNKSVNCIINHMLH